MLALGSQRVEVQEASAVEVVSTLEESVDVLDLREGCQEGIAIIVIADQKRAGVGICSSSARKRL